MATRKKVEGRQSEPTASDRLMLEALQSTHQHADTKAGILAAAQGTLVGTAGAWNGQAVRVWEHGGLAGVVSASLLVLFALSLSGGAICLALALWPRLLRPAGPNRFSFVDLARSSGVPASTTATAAASCDPVSDRATLNRELAETVRFLARVAVVKHRLLMGAVTFTTAMGLSASMFLILRPVML